MTDTDTETFVRLYDDLVDENAELRKELRLIQLNQQSQLPNHFQIVNDQTEQIVFLQKRLSTVTEDLQTKNIEALKLMPLRIQCTELTKENIELKKIRSEEGDIQQECRKLTESLRMTTEENIELKQKVAIFDDLEIQNKQLRSDAATYETKMSLLTSELRHWERKASSLSKELSKVQRQLSKIPQHIDLVPELNRENHELKNRLKEALEALNESQLHKIGALDAEREKSACLSPKILSAFMCTKA